MKLFLLLLFLGLSANSLSAQMPATQRTAAYYSRFVQNSPFTQAAPVSESAVQEQSALSQWALNGFAIMGDKQMVILQSKKDPNEKVLVITGEKNNKNIEILEIQRGQNYLDDKVKLRLAGSLEAWITYDVQSLKKVKPNIAPNNAQAPANNAPQPQPPPQNKPATPAPPARRH